MSVPSHIGFIMDGNRRWAAAHDLRAGDGHREGVKALKATVRHAVDAGVEQMTFYVLSKENFLQRAKHEVKHLLGLMMGWEEHASFMADYGLRLKILGNLGILPQKVIDSVQRAVAKTQHGDRVVNLCLNYSGREEILSAVEDYYKAHGTLPKGEEAIAVQMAEEGRTPVDLIIRTGGNQRLSNFLLWHAAYAELYFTDALWPDFDDAELQKALGWYADQKRNMGA